MLTELHIQRSICQLGGGRSQRNRPDELMVPFVHHLEKGFSLESLNCKCHLLCLRWFIPPLLQVQSITLCLFFIDQFSRVNRHAKITFKLGQVKITIYHLIFLSDMYIQILCNVSIQPQNLLNLSSDTIKCNASHLCQWLGRMRGANETFLEQNQYLI